MNVSLKSKPTWPPNLAFVVKVRYLLYNSIVNRYYLGIGGNGGKTAFFVMDEQGRVLAENLAKEINLGSLSLGEVALRLKDGVERLNFHGTYASVFACLKGIASPSEGKEVRAILRNVPGVAETTFVSAKKDAIEKDGISSERILSSLKKRYSALEETASSYNPAVVSCFLAKEIYASSFLVDLSPRFVKQTWGGERLASFVGCSFKEKIGEAWLLSGAKENSTLLRGGAFDGLSLYDAYEEMPLFFTEGKEKCFPLSASLIDAADDLPVLVHEGEEEAAKSGGKGKAECLFVLDCVPGSTIVSGLNANKKTDVEKAIAASKWSSVLRSVAIRPNDFLFIKPGTAHAIKKGTFLLDIQEPIGASYCLYDYDRPKGELQVSQALVTLDVASKPNPLSDAYGVLCDSKFFYVKRLLVSGAALLEAKKTFAFVYVAKGSITIEGIDKKEGSSFLLSRLNGPYRINGKAELIIAGETLKD
jgi:mannose-6-phosphate isomerase